MTQLITFASFEDVLGISIPILALMIPIVAILASHQQKMAPIIHGSLFRSEIDALRSEVEQLRSMLHHQARTIGELKGQPDDARAPAFEQGEPSLQNRLSS